MFTIVQYISLLVLGGALMFAPSPAQARGDHRAGATKAHNCLPWEGTLSPEQREKAEQILAEARPRLAQVRQTMREKRQELRALSYNNKSDPEDLARLGRQLQKQRDTLREELRALEKRLSAEIGSEVRIRRHHGRGCAALEQAMPCPLPQQVGLEPTQP
ncbi:MAG: periplasmic heavy metal sensor [Desulfovibrionaceae bacterium]